MKNKLKLLLPLLFVIALLAVMTFAVNAEECEHSLTHVEAVEPECHTEGNVEYWYCFNCEQYWLDEAQTKLTVKNMLRIPQLNDESDDDFIEYKAPTCTEDGNYDYWYCDECDSIWNDDYMTNIGLPREFPVIPALGHDYYGGFCQRCGEGCFVFPDDKWYLKGVEYCYENGYMKGVSESSFGYKQTVNRATFVTVLAKIDGTDAPSYDKMSFSDVRPGVWYSNSIEWAYRNGYAAGLVDGIFGYKQNITREQLVTFLYTYSKKKGVDVNDRADISLFNDSSDIHDYARDAMSWAVYAGLVTGTGEATLSPRAFATRAELATIIMNYVEDVLK